MSGRVKRSIRAGVALVAVLWAVSGPARAQDVDYFRIATGSSSGTYFPVGELLASVITLPPGAAECESGGRCGVPGLIAVADASAGSVANVEAVAMGTTDSALAQADVVHWAFHGKRMFKDKARYPGLRVIASLYPESIHLVARRGAGIATVADLAGKRVSLDTAASGTFVDAEMIMSAYGVAPDSFTPVPVDPDRASDMVLASEIDAYFFVTGYPSPGIADLASQGAIDLIAIDGKPADRLRRKQSFLVSGAIPEGTYGDIGEVKTLNVGALWIVSAIEDEELVYQITRALWHPSSRETFEAGHAQARRLALATSLMGVTIPLHPGAERYYREQGVLE